MNRSAVYWPCRLLDVAVLDQLQARTSRKRSARLSDGSCSTCMTAAAEGHDGSVRRRA